MLVSHFSIPWERTSHRYLQLPECMDCIHQAYALHFNLPTTSCPVCPKPNTCLRRFVSCLFNQPFIWLIWPIIFSSCLPSLGFPLILSACSKLPFSKKKCEGPKYRVWHVFRWLLCVHLRMELNILVRRYICFWMSWKIEIKNKFYNKLKILA